VTLEFKLSWRFLNGNRRSLARFTSLAAIAAIAAGVACLIVVQAIGRGFQAEVQEKVLANAPHIALFREDGSPMNEWERAATSIGAIPGVVRIAATRNDSSVITGSKGSAYAVIHVTDTANVKGDEIIVGAELARRTGVEKGDQVGLTGFSGNEPSQNIQFIVGSIVSTGLYENDSTRVMLGPDTYARYFGGGVFMPTVLETYIDDPLNAIEIASKVRNDVDRDFRVMSWTEANQPLFAALSFERRAASAVLILIVFIAAVNITTTVSLLVSERRADIAVLRTNGASTGSLTTIFLIAGVCLGAIGIAAGAVSGLIVIWLVNYLGILNLPPEVYSVSSFALRAHAGDVIAATAGAFAVSVLASLIPAYRASKVKPLANLRT
jgi:lipoprotein-releasing system permease protein